MLKKTCEIVFFLQTRNRKHPRMYLSVCPRISLEWLVVLKFSDSCLCGEPREAIKHVLFKSLKSELH